VGERQYLAVPYAERGSGQSRRRQMGLAREIVVHRPRRKAQGGDNLLPDLFALSHTVDDLEVAIGIGGLGAEKHGCFLTLRASNTPHE
jgi:hypothetical protein